MKIITKNLIFTLLLVSPVFWSSCDKFDKLPLNVPIQFNFNTQGAALTYTGRFCMEDSETYIDYKGDIKKLSLLRVMCRINSVVPDNLEGTFELIVRREDTNEILVRKVVTNFKPLNHKKPNKPYNFVLTGDEISRVNEFLNSNMDQSPCFVGTINLLDIQNAAVTNTLSGTVDVLIEAEVEL